MSVQSYSRTHIASIKHALNNQLIGSYAGELLYPLHIMFNRRSLSETTPRQWATSSDLVDHWYRLNMDSYWARYESDGTDYIGHTVLVDEMIRQTNIVKPVHLDRGGLYHALCGLRYNIEMDTLAEKGATVLTEADNDAHALLERTISSMERKFAHEHREVAAASAAWSIADR